LAIDGGHMLYPVHCTDRDSAQDNCRRRLSRIGNDTGR
jgi:hypothetical protein